jgi:hypothetical protein
VFCSWRKADVYQGPLMTDCVEKLELVNSQKR